MRRSIVLATATLGLALNGMAHAQTSLFDKPAVGVAPEPAPASATPAPSARPKPKPKPKGPVAARSLLVINASGSALTELEVTGGGKSAKLTTTLGSQDKATLKLPPMGGCVVTIMATFERAGEVESHEQNICKDRSVRLTDGPATE